MAETLKIEVSNMTYVRANNPTMLDSVHNCDAGALALPKTLMDQIGTRAKGLTSDIRVYGDTIPEYDRWLRDQLKKSNEAVMIDLDRIFNLALDKGAILVTSRHLTVAKTHAHVIMKLIQELAGNAET